jgi:PST family polysaccharide transporter
VFVKCAVENYLLNENLTKIILFSSVLGAFSNILLNLVLIPIYGINGAAIATIMSYSIAAYVGLLFFNETRPILKMLLKSLNLFRLFKKRDIS